MLPSVRQLQYFVAAAETGKISRAGAMMNVTQSSITIAIRALEDSLGYPLFHRRSNGVELTTQGQIFLQHSLHILAQMQALVDLKPESLQDCDGRVRLGVTETISGYFLSSLISIVRRELPSLDFDLVELSRREVEVSVLRRDLDLGLVMISDIDDKIPFDICPLLVSRRRLWLSASHRLVHQKEVSLGDLVNENYILVQSDNHEEMIKRNWQRHNFTPKIAFRTGSLEAARSLVAAGYGVTILSDLVHRSWSLEIQRIYRRDLKEKISTLITGLIWPAGQLPNKAAARFIDVARHHYHMAEHEEKNSPIIE